MFHFGGRGYAQLPAPPDYSADLQPGVWLVPNLVAASTLFSDTIWTRMGTQQGKFEEETIEELEVSVLVLSMYISYSEW